MNIVKKLVEDNLILIILVLIPLIAGLNLLRPGYFSMHDDVQIMRLYEMEKCLKDGQIPCRWVPDMGAGYGHPLFNYHPVFAYYAGMIFRLFNISFIDTSKLLFFFSFLLSSFFMYLLTKEFFGKIGGVIASVAYVLAPYHSVDIYVRGAMTESWGLVFFPLILFCLYKLIISGKFSYFVLTIFSLFFLLISHNTMPFIFLPVATVWALFWVILKRNKKIIPELLIVFLWAFALSAFFLLPSLAEIKLAKLETMASGYYEFRDHFVTLSQLFINRNWGYGPSIIGPNDTLPFQLGWPLWPVAMLSGFTAIVITLKKKIGTSENYTLIFSLILLGGSVFMTHSKSFYLWNLIPGMSFVQFPWRFLSLSILAMAILAGGLVHLFKSEKNKIITAVIFILLTLILNISYFRPEKYYPEMTDTKKLLGQEWKNQSMTTLNDYVPTVVHTYPTNLAPSQPWVVSGQAIVDQYWKHSDFWRFSANVQGNTSAVIDVPVFEFPEWETVIESTRVDHAYNPETGVIRITVPSGRHSVSGWFRNTPIREIANAITLLSFAALIILIIVRGQKDEAY